MNYDFNIEEAFKIWGYGGEKYNGTNDNNVVEFYNSKGINVLKNLKEIRNDFYKSKAYKYPTVTEQFNNSIKDFLELHPDFPSKKVLQWMAERYCYDCK